MSQLDFDIYKYKVLMHDIFSIWPTINKIQQVVSGFNLIGFQASLDVTKKYCTLKQKGIIYLFFYNIPIYKLIT